MKRVITKRELWDWMMAGNYPPDYPDMDRVWLRPLQRRAYATLKIDDSKSELHPKFRNGMRVKVVMASRLGDVGITDDLTRINGYTNRVMCSVEMSEDDKARFGDLTDIELIEDKSHERMRVKSFDEMFPITKDTRFKAENTTETNNEETKETTTKEQKTKTKKRKKTTHKTTKKKTRTGVLSVETKKTRKELLQETNKRMISISDSLRDFRNYVVNNNIDLSPYVITNTHTINALYPIMPYKLKRIADNPDQYKNTFIGLSIKYPSIGWFIAERKDNEYQLKWSLSFNTFTNNLFSSMLM